jgi:glutathione S-transferase
MSSAVVTEHVLAELGTPHERITLQLATGTRTPEFLRINPNGRVPTIVHDGTAVWEAAAITLYLGETFGVAQGLYPPPGKLRGEAMKWVVWANATLAEAAGRLAQSLPAESGGAEPGTPDWVAPELREGRSASVARDNVLACLRVLDAAVADRPFLLGEGYSLADTHLSTYVAWIGLMGVGLDGLPHAAAWHARCTARPAIARLAPG